MCQKLLESILSFSDFGSFRANAGIICNSEKQFFTPNILRCTFVTTESCRTTFLKAAAYSRFLSWKLLNFSTSVEFPLHTKDNWSKKIGSPCHCHVCKWTLMNEKDNYSIRSSQLCDRTLLTLDFNSYAHNHYKWGPKFLKSFFAFS